ncbi:hypothetical protein [Caenispirillum bisanense]|uniref:Uncharacterized protein n=1 Tax=Caenispirillum bisanense TaxID=414052 RepID=A0A286G844_9PROT|nr:hypothetical protein [Caenispirillum bisanense]SOD91683.1 hypothetical protein SAMN05421508_10254 [Caenispirillum bisanense]
MHVLGGWLGGKDRRPLVIADTLPMAFALRRETMAPVVQAASDLAATVAALRKRFPERRLLVASATLAPLPTAMEAEKLALPAGQGCRRPSPTDPGGREGGRTGLAQPVEKASAVRAAGSCYF